MRSCLISVLGLALVGCVSKPWHLRLVIRNMCASTISVKTGPLGKEIRIRPSARRALGHVDGTITVSMDGKLVACYATLSALLCPPEYVSRWSLPWAGYDDMWLIWGPDREFYMVKPGSSDYRSPGAVRQPKVQELGSAFWKYVSEEDLKAIPQEILKEIPGRPSRTVNNRAKQP
jgi:hypothetical protein